MQQPFKNEGETTIVMRHPWEMMEILHWLGIKLNH